jgi:hypothetical protein
MAATSGVSNSESSGANKRRFADITNLEINEIVKKKDATNTRKSTEQALKTFNQIFTRKGHVSQFGNSDAPGIRLYSM